jgi:plasmid stabilization system protein ParE
MARCRDFLGIRNPRAAERAAQVIGHSLAQLETLPEIGRPYPRDSELRELVIDFGDAGYVALYRYEPASDAVYLLAFRHQREAGY